VDVVGWRPASRTYSSSSTAILRSVTGVFVFLHDFTGIRASVAVT
jgi:hypothetical protein